MSDSEKLIIEMLNRLFWLVTQTPGVARHASDVKLFTDAKTLIYPDRKEANDKLIAGYEKRDK